MVYWPGVVVVIVGDLGIGAWVVWQVRKNWKELRNLS